ncbi:AAA family ATPase [Adhaeretor mobilis]|nr:AAA family ATPase [Adhaeretor mobilis]
MHPYQPHVDYVRFERKCSLNSEYAAKIPCIAATERIDLHSHVMFFIGENGTGKFTLLEAIAVANGFNPEGGTRNFSNTTKDTHADLYNWIKLGRGARGKRRSDGFLSI